MDPAAILAQLQELFAEGKFQAGRAGRSFQRATDEGRELQAEQSRQAQFARQDRDAKFAARRRRGIEARGLGAQQASTQVPRPPANAMSNVDIDQLLQLIRGIGR